MAQTRKRSPRWDLRDDTALYDLVEAFGPQKVFDQLVKQAANVRDATDTDAALEARCERFLLKMARANVAPDL